MSEGQSRVKPSLYFMAVVPATSAAMAAASSPYPMCTSVRIVAYTRTHTRRAEGIRCPTRSATVSRPAHGPRHNGAAVAQDAGWGGGPGGPPYGGAPYGGPPGPPGWGGWMPPPKPGVIPLA